MQTWITSIDQLPPILDYNIRNGRTYMYHKHTPLFPFGHGLTYTGFSYSALKTDNRVLSAGETVKISFKIRNSGIYDSDEVAQLYVSFPDSKVERPALALKGFSRIHVKKGEEKTVTIPLKADDLSYWDETVNKWTFESGRIDFFIGPSSVDKRLEGSLTTR